MLPEIPPPNSNRIPDGDLQRFYNVLCLAYGADAKLFEQVVSDGHLPAERAEGCEDEYAQVKRAMTILIDPFIDEKSLRNAYSPSNGSTSMTLSK